MDKLNVDEKALFAPYLYSDDLRPALQSPSLENDHVCATDLYKLLRIRRELLTGDYKPIKGIKVDKILPPCNFDRTISLKLLEKAIEQCSSEAEKELISPEIECPECDGDGEVEWEYQDKDYNSHLAVYDCPVCRGSGILRPAKWADTERRHPTIESNILVFGQIFRAIYLHSMCETMKLLGLDSVRYVASYKDKANIFNLCEGIDIIIMPIDSVLYSASITD